MQQAEPYIQHCTFPGGVNCMSAKLVGQILGADMHMHLIYQCTACKEIVLQEIELE